MNANVSARLHAGGWLDSLRGFSVFLVFFSHLPLTFPCDVGFILGRIGVVCFFLMSGYLALGSRQRRSGMQYAFNRLLRMYPVYWFLLFVYCMEHWGDVSLVQLAANITLFEKFIGQKEIFGGSWMMPIMVVFFVTVAAISGKVWKKSNTALLLLAFWALMAFLVGLARHMKQLPFPTAFCLLNSVAVLGMVYRQYVSQETKTRTMLMAFGLFELGFLPSVFLSYSNPMSYVIAYHFGFFAFVLFCLKDIRNRFAEFLGSLGFTFFLSAGLVDTILVRFYPYDRDSSAVTIALGCMLLFVSLICFSWVVTHFVERKLLSKGKQWERLFG